MISAVSGPAVRSVPKLSAASVMARAAASPATNAAPTSSPTSPSAQVSDQSWFGNLLSSTFGWMGSLFSSLFSWIGALFQGSNHVS